MNIAHCPTWVRVCLSVALSVTALLPSVPSVRAQKPAPTPNPLGYLYKRETGHNIVEPFLSYFLNNGDVARFGFPLTEQFTDPKTGLKVQYFQNVRMEWHPENPEPYVVQLGLLGQDLGKLQPAIPVSQIPSASDPNCHYFRETGHKACFAFLEYWKSNGGEDAFGYPIAPMTIEGNRTVQYFQRARMEWYPERADQKVQLAQLGTLYYDYAQLDRSRLTAVLPLGQNQTPIPLFIRIRLSVTSPYIARTGQQKITVTVVNQLNQPVSGASVTLAVTYPAPLTQQSFNLPPTNANGISTFTFPAGSKLRTGDLVPVTVYASYSGLTAQTTSSYMIWLW